MALIGIPLRGRAISNRKMKLNSLNKFLKHNTIMANLYSVIIKDFSFIPEKLVLFENVWSKEEAEKIIKQFLFEVLFENKDTSGLLISVIKNDKEYLNIDKEGNIIESSILNQ